MNPAKKLTAILVILMIYGACQLGGLGIRGNGHMITQQRQVGTFHKLSLYGSMNVFVTQGPAKPIEVQAESNLMPYIETQVDGDRLKIKERDGVWFNSTRDINVYVTAENFNELELAGSGNITGQNELDDSQSIRLSVTGSGSLKASLNSPHVEAVITGSGDLDVAGQTRELKIRIAGSGGFRGQDLQTENVNAEILGSGDADVNCSTQLTARIIGSGNLNYKGNPTEHVDVTGSGSVVKK
jgi:hypothetical protein